jgi:hypothetical protein
LITREVAWNTDVVTGVVVENCKPVKQWRKRQQTKQEDYQERKGLAAENDAIPNESIEKKDQTHHHQHLDKRNHNRTVKPEQEADHGKFYNACPLLVTYD